MNLTTLNHIINLAHVIDRWKRIRDGESVNTLPTCKLCVVHHVNLSGSNNCKGCPIAEDTGLQRCEGTPYMRWWECYHALRVERQSTWEDSNDWSSTDILNDLAKKELDYLVGLQTKLITEYNKLNYGNK